MPLIFYLLKVIICSGVLYGYYWLFLRNKVFHHYNRFYLLAVLVLSLTLPLLKFNIWQNTETTKAGVIQVLQVVNSSDEYMDEVILYSRHNHVSKEQVLLWLFVAVSIVFAVFFIRTLLKINSLKKNNPNRQFDGISLINTQDKSTPFSFLKNIFWNDAIDIGSSNGNRILKHELAHVEQKHSHDKLFVNIVLIFFWCNPVFWLLRKELNMIHEFTADKKAVEDGDTAAFAAMILQTTYPKHQFELTNNFFYSPIKRRLAMLTKNNQKVSYISRLLVLPLAILVFAAFTFKAKKMTTTLPVNQTITVVVDAGHGGSDNGAHSFATGQLEKDLDLDLVKKIKSLNSNPAVNIVLLRETDIYQSPKEKAILAKKLGADLFISIHINNIQGADQTSRSGVEVFVAKDNYTNSSNSKLLASAIIASFRSGFALPVAENPIQDKGGVWVLQESACPAVIIQAGYMNNKKDVAYITSEEGQNAFAKKVLEAINNFAANMVVERPVEKTVAVDKIKELSKGNEKNAIMVITDKNGEKTSIGSEALEAKFKGLNGEGTHIDADSFYVVDASQRGNFKLTSYTPSSTIRFRGNANPDPIYVIDGLISPKSSLEALDPQTIQQVNVYKGATAIEKYGYDAKDGVIEIQTKSDKLPITKDAKLTAPGRASGTRTPDTLSWMRDLQGQVKDPKVFTKLEQEAAFPGGKDGWQKYLRANLDANKPVDEGWKAGTYVIMMRFIVNTDGSLRDIVAENHAKSKTAQMCIDFIKKGPKWIPGKQNGKVVASYRKQPITFVISD